MSPGRTLIGTLTGEDNVGRDIENELHSKFEVKRMEREWFHLSENDIDNIINEYGFIRVRNSVKDKKI